MQRVKMTVLGGYDLGERGVLIHKIVDTTVSGDYGADPMGVTVLSEWYPVAMSWTGRSAASDLDSPDNLS